MTGPAASKSAEQVRQINVFERGLAVAELSAPVRRGLKFLTRAMLAQPVIRAARLRIFQSLVGFGYILEFLLTFGILGNVRMVLLGQSAVGFLDLIRTGIVFDAQNLVVILVFHRQRSTHGRCSRFLV